MIRFYAGVGSRETPENVLGLMFDLGYNLSLAGWTLRTGVAPGADQAFIRGACADDAGNVVGYLPWPMFEADFVRSHNIDTQNNPEAWTYPAAAQFHPSWDRLTQGAQKLHARNVHQIRGWQETSPLSSFVICWTKDGEATGGTGQAIRIAQHYKVPVFNLQRHADKQRVLTFLEAATVAVAEPLT